MVLAEIWQPTSNMPYIMFIQILPSLASPKLPPHPPARGFGVFDSCVPDWAGCLSLASDRMPMTAAVRRMHNQSGRTMRAGCVREWIQPTPGPNKDLLLSLLTGERGARLVPTVTATPASSPAAAVFSPRAHSSRHIHGSPVPGQKVTPSADKEPFIGLLMAAHEGRAKALERGYYRGHGVWPGRGVAENRGVEKAARRAGACWQCVLCVCVCVVAFLFFFRDGVFSLMIQGFNWLEDIL